MALLYAAYIISGESDTKIRRAPVWVAMAKAVSKEIGLRFPSYRTQAGLVIEEPQIYQDSHQRGSKRGTDPQDLIELAAVVGAITTLLDIPTVAKLPSEWKGQVPKEIVHERAEKRLSAVELAVVNAGLPRAGLAHNVRDAVSIFLQHKGRM